MPTVESLPSKNGMTTSTNINDNNNDLRDRSRSRSNDNKLANDEYLRQKRAEDDLPLSFASFYYSLKVLKGKDEREDVQKKTFAKWINSQLIKIKTPLVKDLFTDLRDGTILLKLLELLTGKELKKEIGRMKVHHLGNLNIVLSTLAEHKIRLTNISANDIYEGNPKLTLGLVWNIIQHWQVRDVLRTAVYDIHTTNLERALLTWCQNSTKGYAGINIKDFTSSWKDGLAFNALIHKFRSNLFDYSDLYKNKRNLSSTKFAEYNLEHAFNLAQKYLSIERLLDIEDVITDYPDKKSIMMYVMCYFQVLSKPKVIIEDSKDQTEMVLRFRKLKPVTVHKIENSLLFSSLSFNDQQKTSIEPDENLVKTSTSPIITTTSTSTTTTITISNVTTNNEVNLTTANKTTNNNQLSSSSSSPPPYSSSSSSKKSSLNSTKTISTPLGVKNKKQLANVTKSPTDWSCIAATSIDEINCRPVLHTNTTKFKLDTPTQSNRVSVYRINSIVGCAIKFLTEAIFDYQNHHLNKTTTQTSTKPVETVLNNDVKRSNKKKSLRIFTDSSFLMITNSSSKSSFKQDQNDENLIAKSADTDADNIRLTTPSPLTNNTINKSKLDQIMYDKQLDARETVKSIFNLSSQYNTLTRQQQQQAIKTSNKSLTNRNSKVMYYEIAAGKLNVNGSTDVIVNDKIVKRSKSMSTTTTTSSPSPPSSSTSPTNQSLLSPHVPASSDSNIQIESKQIHFIDDDENLLKSVPNRPPPPTIFQPKEENYNLIESSKRLNEYVDLITLSSTSTSSNRYSNRLNQDYIYNQQDHHYIIQSNYLDELNHLIEVNNSTSNSNSNNNRSLSLNMLPMNQFKSNSNRTTMSSSPTQIINQIKRRRQQQQHEYIQMHYQSDQFYDDYDYDYAYDYNSNNLNFNNNELINDINEYNFCVDEPLKLATSKSDKATLTHSFSLNNLNQQLQNKQDKLNEILNENNQLIANHQQQHHHHHEVEHEQNQQETNLNKNSGMTSMSVSSASSTTTTSPILENYLLDLKKVIEWLVTSESLLSNQPEIGDDVNTVKTQFQTHEDFMLDLTKHQNNVGLVLQEGSRLINSGTVSQEDDMEVRKQMKLLNDMWENLRLQAVERQARLHERLMKLQTDQLNQMDAWLSNAEQRIQKINQLADSLDGLIDQKEELSHLQDDLVKEQEAVDCLKQIIVVVDDNTDDQAFIDLENKLSNLSDRWSNVCKFVGNRWFTVQDLIIKLQSIDSDFNDLNIWISNKSQQLNSLIKKTKHLVVKNKLNVNVEKFSNTSELDEQLQMDYVNNNESPTQEFYEKIEFTSSIQLIKILKEIEIEMQAMHAKLNDMNEIGEQIGTQLNESPQLSNSINSKMDTLEAKWNYLLEKMEYLSRVCTEQQQIEIIQQKQQHFKRHHVLQPIDEQSSVTSNVKLFQQQQQQQQKKLQQQTQQQQQQSFTSTSKSVTTSSSTTTTTTSHKSVVETSSSKEAIAIATSSSSSSLQQQQQQQSQTTKSSIKKRRMQSDEVKKHTSIDSFVSQLNVMFDNVKKLIEADDLSPEEYLEVIKKAQIEIQVNEECYENMQQIAQNLKENMKAANEDSTQLESLVEQTNLKWHETSKYIDELAISVEKKLLSHKAYDELATLRDVHEGYQRYINNAESLSTDVQKLNLQLETNKVKLKGMNSYEPRLNDLKQLTNQLDNKDLVNEIENFSLKWSETYTLINNRNEEIFKREQTDQKLKEQSLQQQPQLLEHEQLEKIESTTTTNTTTTTQTSKMMISTSSSTATSAAAQTATGMTTTSISESIRIQQNYIDNLSDGNASDEDILHVVTNVYTIPIIKSTSAGNGPFLQSSQPNLNQTTSFDDDLLNQRHHHKISSSTSVPISVINDPFKRIIDTTSHQQTSTISTHEHHAIAQSMTQSSQDSAKSKFQIRSIVEIYENQPESSSSSAAGTQTSKNEIDLSFKSSTHVEETTHHEIITEPLFKDERQNSIHQNELQNQPSKSYTESKQVLVDWLSQIEKSLTSNDFQITFLPVLEERLQSFKEINNELKVKQTNLDLLQQSVDELATKATNELNYQLKSDLKLLKSDYQSQTESVQERLNKLERLINDLKKLDEDYTRMQNSLNKVEAQMQIEHHSSVSHGLTHGKSIEIQLDHLKQVKYDLESQQSNMFKLNEQFDKYFYVSNIDQKFLNKLKSDVNSLNEKYAQLKTNYSKKYQILEEAFKKSTKVDSEIDDLDRWIGLKDHETPDDDGVILNEEQFDIKLAKYKQLKVEIDRREPEVKRILETGNEMLKNSTGGVSNVADLARSMININTKWSNLNKKVDAKNKLFTQLNEYINELRQLLHEEKIWLERVEKKLAASKIGADAEELSEELDSLERFIKSHPQQARERISELSSLLIEKSILIQLANSDTKEFLFRWQLIHEEAQKKIQSLDSAISDVQSWERRLLELQEWMTYMDKYLTTRIDQDIFADDVPDDFQRIQEEFNQNDLLLKELDDGVDKYRIQGKLDAAQRLESQLNVLKKNWLDLQSKLKKFQKPADFDQKLLKVKKLLDEIDQALYMIDVNTEDSDTIHLQLEHCMKFYKTLSEVKSQIEFVLKQGRSIVDKKQVDNTDELTKQLDTLKQKYNDLGSRVTNGKNDLEKAFKIAKKFRKEYNVINDFMSKIDGELRKIEQKPLSKNYNDELEWIKNTKNEINKVGSINLETMKSLRKSLEELIKIKSTGSTQRLAGAQAKVTDVEQKVQQMQRRIDDRAQFLHEQAQRLEESYVTFLQRTRQCASQIEILQHQLIEAERSNYKELFDKIEREANGLLSDVEMIRAQGADLCSKSEQYSKVVETELRNVISNFENLNQRLNLAQERSQQQEELTTTTVTTETSKKHHQHHSKRSEELKYSRSRRTKSPSESSVDSTVDVFDTELRQKYMRAVAYLRILDEAPLIESQEDEQSRFERHEYANRSDAIDIDFVIQQARQVAQMNESTNPERSKRILEKVHKLEQRWAVTKNKRDSFKTSSNLYKKYQEREEQLTDQISILEEKLLEYRSDKDDDWDPPNFYGPSDFIYDNELRVPICQPACQHTGRTAFQQHRYQENCDTHSVVSEPAISRHIIVKEVPVCQPQPEPTIIRKYITTKTTTTHQGIPPNMLPNTQQFIDQQHQQHHLQHSSSSSNINKENIMLMNGQKFQSSSGSQQRSSSIPASQQRIAEEVLSQGNSSMPSTTTRYITTRNYTTTSNADQLIQQQQQQHQQQQQQKKSESVVSQKRKTTTSKTHTLPVNFSQNSSSGYQTNVNSSTMTTNTATAGGVSGGRNSNSSSCIDYSNTFYNSDWKMRHGNIEKPLSATSIPIKTSLSTSTTIPIYQQHPNQQSNIAYSLDGIVMQ